MAERSTPVEIVPITTGGDAQQTGPIGAIGSQGVFTKEIQRALLEETIDLAVHSLKDLPTEPVEGLCLAAVPPREDVADAIVCRRSLRQHVDSADTSTADPALGFIPQGARVGTGSLRRRAQLLHVRGDLQVLDIRGNVDTRLRRLDEGEYDAVILAVAGLTRLKLADRITSKLPLDIMLPAVGQGALGIETRQADLRTRDFVARLDDVATHRAVLAERALLAELRGGCLAPIGAWARIEGTRLRLTGCVVSLDGKTRLLADESIAFDSRQDAVGAVERAEELGRQVAKALLADGAADLIASARG